MTSGLAYYEQNYKDYELQNPLRKARYYHGLLSRGLAGRSWDGLKILDVGCAFGGFLGTLPQSSRRFGQEMIAEAVDVARGAVPGADFRCHCLPEIAFVEVFDAIVAFDVLEHVPDLQATKSSILGKLSPTGTFVFVVPVYDGITGPIISLLDKDPTHVHKRSRWFWLDWLGAEFEIVDWVGIYRYLLGRWYLHYPTRALRRHTPAIAVVARPTGS